MKTQCQAKKENPLGLFLSGTALLPDCPLEVCNLEVSIPASGFPGTTNSG